MMRTVLAAILLIGAALSSPVAGAEKRCVAAYYQMPPSIANEMRPYLLCGVIHDRGDTGGSINGHLVHMGLNRVDAGCGDVRAKAFAAADQRLTFILRDAKDRQAYLDSQFKRADEFLKTATNLDDLGVGEAPNAQPCRSNEVNGAAR